jgi:hypothetical protein
VDLFTSETGKGELPTSFEAIIPRPLLNTVIDMYFDYVYCIVPFPHPPTFLADYHGHREQTLNQHEWTAMVFAMVSFTISLVPQQILPGDKQFLRGIATRSVEYAKAFLAEPFAGTSLQRCELLTRWENTYTDGSFHCLLVSTLVESG